jgi:type II secretion system protein C
LDDVSTAIISTPDNKQGHFKVGEEIWNDVTLERVLSSEQVVILASGVRETLTLINRDPEEVRAAALPPARPQAASSGLRPASGGFVFGDVARISPSMSGDGLRLVVQPGANRGAFDASGLKPGDVIVAIENRRIGADIVAEARRIAEMQPQGSIALTVERDGVSVPVELKLSRGALRDGQ